MGCIESMQRKAARHRSKQISDRITTDKNRKNRTIEVLVVGAETADKQKAIQDLKALARVLDQTPKDKSKELFLTSTKYIEETHFAYKNKEFRILDLASDVSITRTKWMGCLEDVNIIVFVLDISKYDMTEEGETENNHIYQSMKLFEDLCNCRWFREKSILIYLNNVESFQNKIKVTPFRNVFPQYEGSDDLNDVSEYILCRLKDLDHTSPSPEIYKQIFCIDGSWLSAFNNMIDMFSGDEIIETWPYGHVQYSICDEPWCNLCIYAIWMVLRCCCMSPCCRSSRQLRYH